MSQEPMLIFLAKHVESVITRAGHIDKGTLSHIIEKSKISIKLNSIS